MLFLLFVELFDKIKFNSFLNKNKTFKYFRPTWFMTEQPIFLTLILGRFDFVNLVFPLLRMKFSYWPMYFLFAFMKVDSIMNLRVIFFVILPNNELKINSSKINFYWYIDQEENNPWYWSLSYPFSSTQRYILLMITKL